MVSWLNPKKSFKPIINGPGCLSFNDVAVKVKAYLPSQINKAQLVDSYSGDLGVSLHSNQNGYELGESSRLSMEPSVVLASPEVPTGVRMPSPIPDKATETFTSNPKPLHPGREGDSANSNTAVES